MPIAHDLDTRPDAVTSAAHATPAPGKKTKTESLPSTGVPFVDDGAVCERDAAGKVCFLTESQRTRLAVAISNRAGIVGANSRDALQDSRIDELMQQPGGWGALAEFMFYSLTGPIIGSIVAGVKAGAYAARSEDVKALLTNVSRAQRKQLQGMVSVAPGKESKVRFLELCRDSIGPWQAAMYEDAPRDLDDEGLTALKDALDPGALNVDFFKARIADMLSRFETQKIDQVGVEAIYRHGVPMWIGHGKTRRLVLLEDNGLHHHAGVMGPKPRDLVQKADDSGKPIVVDKDLEPMAIAFYRERTGKMPVEMDVEAAIAKGGDLAKVASEIVLEVLELGGGS